MGSGRALLAPQQGPGRNHGQNQTFETLPWHRRTQVFLQWREFTGDGSRIFYKGTEPGVRDEAKWSKLWRKNVKLAYIRVQFLTFSCTKFSASEMTYIVSSGALNSTHSLTVQSLGYNEHRSRTCTVFLCKHTIKNIQWRLNPFNPLWVRQCSGT